MPRADRLFSLVQLLSGARFRSLADLTEELRTTPRTIYRDLAGLEERGLAIERFDGTYRIAPSSSVRALPLTDRERILLAVVLENPALERQPAFGKALRDLRRKLAGVHALSSPAARVAGPERSGAVAQPVVDALDRSIRESHSASILYTSLSARRSAWRGVDPWLMMHRCDAWYLIGRCHTHDEPRTFRLDRIQAVLPIGSSFEKPRDFDPDTWFANSWGVAAGGEPAEVVIVFDEEVAPLIEHARHHPSEVMRKLGDGSIEYRVRVSPSDEIARWVCGFGGAARVVSPEALIDRVHSIASSAADAHKRNIRAAAMVRRAKKSVTDSDTARG